MGFRAQVVYRDLQGHLGIHGEIWGYEGSGVSGTRDDIGVE